MSYRIIGIDIRHDDAYVVQVRAGMKRVQIEATAQVALSEHTTVEEDLRQLIGALCDQLDISDAAVALSLPADYFYVRRVDFPFRNSAKIRQALPFEIEATLPVAADILALDFLLLPQKQKGARQAVLAAAIDQSQLAKLMTILTEFAIEPELVTIGAWPMAAAIAPPKPSNPASDETDEPKPLVMLLTGASTSWTLFVCESHKVLATRNFRLAASDQDSWSSLTAQMRLSMVAMLDRGEIEALPGQGYFSGQLPVEIAEGSLSLTDDIHFRLQPLGLMQMHQVTLGDGAKSFTAAMDNALALALCRSQQLAVPNFHRQHGRAMRLVDEHRPILSAAAALLVLVLVLSGVNAWLDLHLLNQRVERLDRQIKHEFQAVFPEVKRIVDPLQQMRSKIDTARAETSSDLLTLRGLSVVDIINELSRILPADWNLLLTDVTVGPENMTLTGTTSAFNTVDQIRDRLAGQPWVESAVISAANMNKSGDAVRFKIRVNFTVITSS